jgi:hypothetical protein
LAPTKGEICGVEVLKRISWKIGEIGRFEGFED